MPFSENLHEVETLFVFLPVKVAILAWGSLVWNSGSLPYEGEWHMNGPMLPIEFSRVSKDARLTLVVDPCHGAEVNTRFTTSTRDLLFDAVADLRDREGTSIKYIGFTDIDCENASFREYPKHSFAHERLLPWLRSTSFEAVIWTALPSNYRKQQHDQPFSVEHAVNCLRSLPESPRSNAYEYIRRAPAEVRTPLRTRLEELGLLKV